ncbi:hypothetical protein [Denitratisoma oestradiolicum]|uniref:NnrS family protein n=1 Tax=Denitratisoma oestradiolicum TaxID=311182 RepID=A0A6S6YTG1_9PROT|nr:hypothetical protein [Denitratisoma oestradiolicum]TWO81834.1 hypothetical protein CBW56_03795 [Denitratisoma oestradiolicum]CAB1370802.1 conserved membrane protein of unknown function [Denitratisoma oestradiolicum]
MRLLPPSPALRLPLLLMGMAALVVGVLAGLSRLAVDLPAPVLAQAGGHGALMICAFLGTVISLERAVALARGWAYLAPLAAGLGGLLLLAGVPPALTRGAFVFAAAILFVASFQVVRQQFASFTVTLALAALCWLTGNLVWWLTTDMVAAVPWWMSFLVLTIAGERLELTRLLPTPPLARRGFAVLAGLLPLAAALGLARPVPGQILYALGLLGLAFWLLRYDIARTTVRQQGLTRFIAVCLLSGYAWLATAGLLGLLEILSPAPGLRDASLHTVFLGFVFSMIFGHAPIIFPAVLKVKIPYHPVFYLPLAALHLSLTLRLAGDLGAGLNLAQAGGIANGLALLLFIVTMIGSVIRGRRQ